jgi:hypothetical protein
MKTNIDYLVGNKIIVPAIYIENKDKYDVNIDFIGADTYIRIGLPKYITDFEIIYKGTNPFENS